MWFKRDQRLEVDDPGLHHEHGIGSVKRLSQGAGGCRQAHPEDDVVIIMDFPGHDNDQEFVEGVRLTHKAIPSP